jgi:hypothetical protein
MAVEAKEEEPPGAAQARLVERALREGAPLAALDGLLSLLQWFTGLGSTDEKTALMKAAEEGQEAAVARLIPLSDPRAKTSKGQTALTLAAIGGRPGCVQALLPVCDAGEQDQYGLTALMWAAKARGPGHEACVAALSPVSDMAAVDDTGWTPLMWAIEGANPAGARLLAPLSDLSAQTASGLTAQTLAERQVNLVKSCGAPSENEEECLRLVRDELRRRAAEERDALARAASAAQAGAKNAKGPPGLLADAEGGAGARAERPRRAL